MSHSVQDDAFCYVLGLMEHTEAVALEHRICKSRHLLFLFRELAELAASILIAEARLLNRCPDARLRAEVLRRVGVHPQHSLPTSIVTALREASFDLPGLLEGVVYSTSTGEIRWANRAFTSLCGYDLAELQGRTAGPLLQGADSDRFAAEALTKAVHQRTPTLQRIVNYHKNGTPYLVEIDLRPVKDGFVAIERVVENE